MAIDAMKLLGALLNSGALSRGSGSNILGSLLGSVMGGSSAPAAAPAGGGGLGGLLGGLFGGGSGSRGGMFGNAASASAGGLGDLLGGLMGGGSGGGLGDLLGAAMKQFGGGPGGADLSNFQPNIQPEQANEQALILVRAMIDAAKADGQVDAQEQEKIIQGFGSDVSEEELAFLREEMARPLDVNDLVRQVPRGMEKQVYLMSLTAIDLDTNPEAQYLHQLAQGLGLDAATVNAIHDQAGAPRLYS